MATWATAPTISGVSATSKDPNIVTLYNNVINAQTVLSNAGGVNGGTAQANNAIAAVKAAEDALVLYLINSGRLQSYNILTSTL